MSAYDLQRFLIGQAENYDKAVQELTNGKVTGRWMWYVFPQLRFFGQSQTAYFYGLDGLAETKAYCQHETLHARYLQCCRILEDLPIQDSVKIFGLIDSLKLCSSLTLFYHVDEDNRELYQKLLDKFYDGCFDANTLQLMQNESE